MGRRRKDPKKQTVSSKPKSSSATQRFLSRNHGTRNLGICLPLEYGTPLHPPIVCHRNVRKIITALRCVIVWVIARFSVPTYLPLCLFCTLSFPLPISSTWTPAITIVAFASFRQVFYTQNYSYTEPLPGKRVDTTADVRCSHNHYMRKRQFFLLFSTSK